MRAAASNCSRSARAEVPRRRRLAAQFRARQEVSGDRRCLRRPAPSFTCRRAESRWLLDQWLADQGFIVVAIDNRGTPGRGRDWERAIYQKFGRVPLEDQVAGLKALGAKYPAMDLDRVGIDGWSFGGYMAALAVMRRPDVFKAGVAGAPVTDWHDYDTHYTERYLGVPPEGRRRPTRRRRC